MERKTGDKTHHDTLRQRRLRHHHRPEPFKDLHERGILFRRLERPPHIAEGGIHALDVELVFQCDGDAVEGPGGLVVGGEVGV